MAALHCPNNLDHKLALPPSLLHVHTIGLSSLCQCLSDKSYDLQSCSDSSLLHCARLIQRMACQSNVDYTSLHKHVDGLASWPDGTPCICGTSGINNLESPSTYHLNHLTHDQLCLLWHQCLGHLHSRRVSDMHKFAIGVPSVLINMDIDRCPICATAKLHKAAHGQSSS